MAGHPSKEKGAGGADDDEGNQPHSGLDAKLDRAIPTGDADAFLLRIGGASGGRVYPLSHNTVFLGRAEDSDVCVFDPSVSVRHARIINGSQGFEIEDLNSTNGTFVEGSRIVRTRLQNGDRVTLGQVEFKFLIDRRVDATLAVVIPPSHSNMAPGGSLIRYAPPRMPGAGVIPQMASEDADETPSLAEMIQRLVHAYRFLRKNARLMAILVTIGAVMGGISVLALPPPAESSCLVKLDSNVKTNPIDPQGRPVDDEDSTQFFAGAERAFTQPELVVDTLRKVEDHEPDPAKVDSTVLRLRFEPVMGPGHLYRATYRDRWLGDARPPAVPFLDEHLRNYLEHEITRALRVFKAETDFLSDQLKSVEQEMNRISTERTIFREKNSDRLPEEAGLNHSSRFTLETHRADLLAQVRRVQGELEVARRQLVAEGPVHQARFQASQVYRQSLAEINRKLTEAYAAGFAEGHPDIVKLQDEKHRIEQLVHTEMESGTSQADRRSNTGIQSMQNQVDALQAQLTSARSDLVDTEQKLGQIRHLVGDLPRVEEHVKQLTHSQEEITGLHTQLFERLKKAELRLNLERVSAESRYEIVAPPMLVTPGRAKTGVRRTGIGFLIGLVLAAAVMAVREAKRIVSQAILEVENRKNGGVASSSANR